MDRDKEIGNAKKLGSLFMLGGLAGIGYYLYSKLKKPKEVVTIKETRIRYI